MKKVKIIYDSLTGNGKRFLQNFPVESIDINDFLNNNMEFEKDTDYILETRNIGFGKITDETLDFLEDFGNNSNLIGTLICGNRVWGENYGRSGYTIKEEYKLPIIRIFELSGFEEDIKFVKDYLIEKEYMKGDVNGK